MSGVVLSWSGGKDAAMALAALRAQGREVRSLLTTLSKDDGRVPMHGAPIALVRAQAEALDLPLREVALPARADNATYARAVLAALAAERAAGADAVAFGDLFLEDIRAWRDALVAPSGMRALYPVWGRDTAPFARRVLAAGVRAVVCSVDVARLDPAFAGRAYDADLLADLPPDVDPCGERGEFHTFVHDGPGFARPVAFAAGAAEVRDRFAILALALAPSPAPWPAPSPTGAPQKAARTPA